MKKIFFITITAALLSLHLHGQTNITISFTNSWGDYVTNAQVISWSANKLIYRCASGGGIIRLDKLPPDLQKKFAFDPDKAAALDAQEKQKQEQQQATWNAESARIAYQQRWHDAYTNALARGVDLEGTIVQKIQTSYGTSLLVSWPGSAVDPHPFPSVTVLLVDEPGAGGRAADDNIFLKAVYPIGLYSYTTVNHSENTVHVWTCDINRATRYYYNRQP